MVPRLRECCRQGQAEVVSDSRNKIHQTWGPPFSRALYIFMPERKLTVGEYVGEFGPQVPDYVINHNYLYKCEEDA